MRSRPRPADGGGRRSNSSTGSCRQPLLRQRTATMCAEPEPGKQHASVCCLFLCYLTITHLPEPNSAQAAGDIAQPTAAYAHMLTFDTILQYNTFVPALHGRRLASSVLLVIKEGGGYMISWSELFSFVAIIISLVRLFITILGLIHKSAKTRSNRPRQR